MTCFDKGKFALTKKCKRLNAFKTIKTLTVSINILIVVIMLLIKVIKGGVLVLVWISKFLQFGCDNGGMSLLSMRI